MEFTVSRETLSEISEGLVFVIRGMKKIRKSIAIFCENHAGHFGNSSPEGKNTRAVTTITKTGIPLPKVSSVGLVLHRNDKKFHIVPLTPGTQTLLHADLTAEAVQWLHRSKFSVAGVPGALPFGEHCRRGCGSGRDLRARRGGERPWSTRLRFERRFGANAESSPAA